MRERMALEAIHMRAARAGGAHERGTAAAVTEAAKFSVSAFGKKLIEDDRGRHDTAAAACATQTGFMVASDVHTVAHDNCAAIGHWWHRHVNCSDTGNRSKQRISCRLTVARVKRALLAAAPEIQQQHTSARR